MVAEDLSTQRFNRDEYLSLITTGSPARDDDSGRQHTVIRRETNWQKRYPAPVISTEAKRSGEISRRNVARHMVAGGLSTLRFIRAQSLCHPYRRVSPLEMTMSAGSIQSFSGANYPKRCPASPVISTAAKRSGEISRRKAARPMVTGDLSALRFIRVQSPYHPYRRVPPLEMTVLAGCIQSFSGSNYPKRYPAPVISTEAKRSGEISLRSVTSSIMAGDLSALRFISPQSPCHPYRQVSLERTHGWRLAIRIIHQKRAVKNDSHFSTALSDGFLFLITSF